MKGIICDDVITAGLVILCICIIIIALISLGNSNCQQEKIEIINDCNYSCEVMDYKYFRIKFNKNINLNNTEKYSCYCVYNQSIIKIW